MSNYWSATAEFQNSGLDVKWGTQFIQSFRCRWKDGSDSVLLPYFYVGKWEKGEGKVEMKETPTIIVMGDVKHLSYPDSRSSELQNSDVV